MFPTSVASIKLKTKLSSLGKFCLCISWLKLWCCVDVSGQSGAQSYCWFETECSIWSFRAFKSYYYFLNAVLHRVPRGWNINESMFFKRLFCKRWIFHSVMWFLRSPIKCFVVIWNVWQIFLHLLWGRVTTSWWLVLLQGKFTLPSVPCNCY